jgi:hypothetical protein
METRSLESEPPKRPSGVLEIGLLLKKKLTIGFLDDKQS